MVMSLALNFKGLAERNFAPADMSICSRSIMRCYGGKANRNRSIENTLTSPLFYSDFTAMPEEPMARDSFTPKQERWFKLYMVIGNGSKPTAAFMTAP